MLTILTVIGARPQIIKAAALSRAIRGKFSGKIREIIVHTGQHYDSNMSQVFFEELSIPAPDYNLNTGSGDHGAQTAKMIEGIEALLLKEKPGAIVLYGDTNSTLAGAVAASKLHIPVVHIEAGLRSFNKTMPEEVNRILCDHVSTLLFSPTRAGYNNLLREGFKKTHKGKASADRPNVYHCGDVMYDNSLYAARIAEQHSPILKNLHLESGKFLLGTIHRNNNTDDPARLNAIFQALLSLTALSGQTMVLPLHPRTEKMMDMVMDSALREKVRNSALLRILPPASFFDMVCLEKNCSMVVTDSGGVQKEAYFFRKPCLILRSETEWVELVKCGAACITDASTSKIIAGYKHFSKKQKLRFPPLFGNGRAAEFICREMIRHLA
ncbi:MAG: UDP-N-acetylglucosamine 2-epimerase (non-hydrolyzing) [Bacteroidia bacterium]|nr:UDP-N-acetylglucosamine 2-epimerase (non-hydrolyzing) [Bacteroidia bacterium]